jgi:hypothetical protein
VPAGRTVAPGPTPAPAKAPAPVNDLSQIWAKHAPAAQREAAQPKRAAGRGIFTIIDPLDLGAREAVKGLQVGARGAVGAAAKLVGADEFAERMFTTPESLQAEVGSYKDVSDRAPPPSTSTPCSGRACRRWPS